MAERNGQNPQKEGGSSWERAALLRAAGALLLPLYKIERGRRRPRLKNSENFFAGSGNKGRGIAVKRSTGQEQKCYKEISGRAEPAAAIDGKSPENQIFSAIWEPKKKTALE